MATDSHYVQWIEQEYRRLARHREPFVKLATRLFRRGPAAGQKIVARFYRVAATVCLGGSLAVGYELAPLVHPFATVVLGLGWVGSLCYTLCTYSENVKGISAWLREHSAEPLAGYHMDKLLLHLERESPLQETVVGMLKRQKTHQLTTSQGRRLLESARNIDHWREMEKQRLEGLKKLETLGLVSQAQTQQRAQTLHERLPAPQEPQARNRF